MLQSIRKRLGLKLFLSYLVVIVVGMLVLGITTRLVIPTAFQHHMADMSSTKQEVRESPV